jgi:thiol-disulfide isomerase/thioredoxin
MVNRPRNERGRFVSPKSLDVRSQSDVPELESLIHGGPVTFVLIHADWCGHCQTYKPMWAEFEEIPGRIANMAMVHHDMVEKCKMIKDAKIEGYPSVIKVSPKGEIETYNPSDGSGEPTNAIPFMRDKKKFENELVSPSPNSGKGSPQGGVLQNIGPQAGGSIMSAFVGAIQKAAPAALLLLANQSLSSKGRRAKSFKSPKRMSRRASSRRNRTYRRR